MFATIQLLWDRGEADGYAQHITTDALPNTPKHTVLMHVAFGDHQVSDTTAEVEARTIGARGYQPVLDAGRSPWRRFQLIPSIGKFPFGGSAIVIWDSGTPAPPITNTPNRGGEDPAFGSALHAGRAGPEVGVPEGRRASGRRVRRRALP